MKSCYKSEKLKVLLRYRVHKNACLQGAGITIGFSFHHPSRITGTQKTTTKTLLPNASFKEAPWGLKPLAEMEVTLRKQTLFNALFPPCFSLLMMMVVLT